MTPENDSPFRAYREQAILTLKVLLIGGGTIGALALLDLAVMK